MAQKTLGVGFIGSGFITRFHIRSWQAVRGADVRGVWSPTATHAEEAAALARSLHVGEAKAFSSIAEMAADPAIDCIWICGPNYARVENMEEIVHARSRGAELVGVACEKPLGTQCRRSARMLELAERPACCTGISRTSSLLLGSNGERTIVWARGAALAGRPYLARAAEEHGGPHMPWFWRGDLQGGGVLERHDVPQPRGRTLPADAAGCATPQHQAGQGIGADRLAQVVAARIRRSCSRT